VQQVPTGEEKEGFRECFKPEEGNVFVVSDYSGQESRAVASMAEEKAMIEFFNGKDDDMHSYSARRMFKVPVSKTENKHLRQLGKILGFSINYGASAHKVADTFQVSNSEAQTFIDKYYDAYPDLKVYFDKCHNKAKQKGYILTDSLYKRRIYITEYKEYKELEQFIERYKKSGWVSHIPKKVWSRYYTIKGGIERNSQNWPIQSLSASMTKLATCLMFE